MPSDISTTTRKINAHFKNMAPQEHVYEREKEFATKSGVGTQQKIQDGRRNSKNTRPMGSVETLLSGTTPSTEETSNENTSYHIEAEDSKCSYAGSEKPFARKRRG